MAGEDVLPLHLRLALSVDDVAMLLQISRSSAYELVRSGRLQRIPHLPRIRVARAELDRFTAAGVTATDPVDSPATVAATAWADAPLTLVGRRR